MAHTRGGQAPKRAGPTSKSKTSGSSAPAKRRSHRIAAGASKRACKPVIPTTIPIPDSPSAFDYSPGNSASTQFAVAPSSPAQRSSPTHEQSPPSASPSPPPLPPHRLLDQFPGDWLPSPSSQSRFQSLRAKSISVCDKLDISFFASEQFEFFEKLVKDKCLGLLDLGNVVYPRLVRLFYANLKTKTTANGVFFESVVKSVKITLSRSVLESIFGLKFVDTAPPNLSRKVAKDLCLQQFANPQKLDTYTRQNKAPPIMF